MPAMALSLRECSVRLGGAMVLEGLSLDVRRGEIVGLAGPNGCGKSTTLALAAGLLKAESGRMQVERLGYVPQDTALYEELTPAQNLEFFGQIQGLRGIELDTRIARGLARSRLTLRADDRVERFSGGMKQRLSIACALMHEPPLLLLDEPTASLDPTSRDDLFRDLLQLKDDGHAILLTTHHVEETQAICDRTLMLANGRIQRPPERVTSPLLYGHLREPLADYSLRELQARFEEDGVLFEVTGRRVRLAADTSEALGRALAMLLAEGATLETFRTAGSAVPVRASAR